MKDLKLNLKDWTHAEKIGPCEYQLYTVADCEVCGCDCKTGNTVNLKGVTKTRLRAEGLTVVAAREHEDLGACDALNGIAVCPGCYKDEDEVEVVDIHLDDCVDADEAIRLIDEQLDKPDPEDEVWVGLTEERKATVERRRANGFYGESKGKRHYVVLPDGKLECRKSNRDYGAAACVDTGRKHGWGVYGYRRNGQLARACLSSEASRAYPGAEAAVLPVTTFELFVKKTVGADPVFYMFFDGHRILHACLGSGCRTQKRAWGRVERFLLGKIDIHGDPIDRPDPEVKKPLSEQLDDVEDRMGLTKQRVLAVFMNKLTRIGTLNHFSLAGSYRFFAIGWDYRARKGHGTPSKALASAKKRFGKLTLVEDTDEAEAAAIAAWKTEQVDIAAPEEAFDEVEDIKPLELESEKRTYETREDWLVAAVPELVLILDAAATREGIATREDRPVPYMSVGWPKAARGKKAVAQCWSAPADSKSGKAHIFVSPERADAVTVLDDVLHELIHDAVGNECGHKGPFVKLMKAAGLEGKATATYAGEELKTRLEFIASKLGSYPHEQLTARPTAKPPQRCRQRKYTCPECGQIIRAATDDLEVICGKCSVVNVEDGEDGIVYFVIEEK